MSILFHARLTTKWRVFHSVSEDRLEALSHGGGYDRKKS